MVPFEIISRPPNGRSILRKSWFTSSLFVFVIATIFSVYYWNAHSTAIISPTISPTKGSDPSLLLFDGDGHYVMRNFDLRKPMSNFLAGLGGVWGTPLWAFFVNRGQGITSFGIQNKDNAILKFNTAEKAYQQTPFTGFRTFVRGTRSNSKWNHMPFFPRSGTQLYYTYNYDCIISRR